MNIQEILKRVIELNQHYYIENVSCSNKIIEVFEQYAKENQASETENQSSSDTDIKKYIDEKLENYRQLNARYNMDTKAEIKTMQKEIEALKQKNETQIEFNQAMLKDVKGLVADVQNMQNSKAVEEPKQERFYFKRFADSLYYQIYDRNNIFGIEYLYDCYQAEEICKALNQLEDLKK